MQKILNEKKLVLHNTVETLLLNSINYKNLVARRNILAWNESYSGRSNQLDLCSL